MQSEFDRISTYEGWTSKLDQLLADARAASESGSDSQRAAIARRLTTFIEVSSPASPEIVALDNIAASAVRLLWSSIASHAVDRIAARTAALRQLSDELVSISRAASTSAAQVALSSETQLVTVLARAAQSIADLPETSAAASDDNLRSGLLELLDAIATIQSAVRQRMASSAAQT